MLKTVWRDSHSTYHTAASYNDRISIFITIFQNKIKFVLLPESKLITQNTSTSAKSLSMHVKIGCSLKVCWMILAMEVNNLWWNLIIIVMVRIIFCVRNNFKTMLLFNILIEFVICVPNTLQMESKTVAISECHCRHMLGKWWLVGSYH